MLEQVKLGESIRSDQISSTYRAEALYHGEPVELVVKQVRGSGLTHNVGREAWILAQIQGPRVVPFLGYDSHNKTAYLRRVPGVELHSLFGKGPQDSATEIVADVAAGLEYIHAADIVHNDVNPTNVIFGDTATWIDFGMSYHLSAIPQMARRFLGGKTLVHESGGAEVRETWVPPEKRFCLQHRRPYDAEEGQSGDVWGLGNMARYVCEGARISSTATAAIKSALSGLPKNRPTAREFREAFSQ